MSVTLEKLAAPGDVDYFAAVDALSAPPALLPPALPPLPPRRVRPGGVWVDLLLTARSPISHHDPVLADKSNTLLFNRRRQFVPVPTSAVGIPPAVAASVCAAHPVPADITALFEGLSLAEFTACALLRVFLDLYNGLNDGDGVGVFSGLFRYERLETRLRAAAVRAWTLRGLWDRLVDALQVPLHGGAADGPLLRLFALPRSLQATVLAAVTADYRSVVMLAREWHRMGKLQNAEYAAKAKEPQAAPSVPVILSQTFAPGGANAIIDVPHVSANSLRHQVVRGPGWQHLADRLELPALLTGQGELSAGVEAVFENGGNIAAGAKQPSNPFGLAAQVRAAHPLLELLGGTTDSFDLGASRLHVGSWLLCRENAAALRGTPAEDLPALSVSAFDLLDDVTATRQATERGEGQMIYSFETLCAGTQLLCRLHLAPDTGRLALGALAAATETYLHSLPAAGGQKARGFGWMGGELLTCPPEWEECMAEYERYLDDHAQTLRAGLVDGTLGASARVVT